MRERLRIEELVSVSRPPRKLFGGRSLVEMSAAHFAECARAYSTAEKQNSFPSPYLVFVSTTTSGGGTCGGKPSI